MAITVKKLEWKPGRDSRGRVYFDEAETPFGNYSVWYSDGSLWIPQKAEYSKHGDVDSAKAAAQEHLRAAVASLVTEE